MPARLINAPNTIWGQPLSLGGQNEQVVLEVVNNSGGTLAHGDVVVWDVSTTFMPTVGSPQTTAQDGGRAVTTTTTANDQTVAGVVTITGDASTNGGTVAAGANCMICIGGVARVQIGANTVTKGTHILQTFTSAKQATGIANASALAGAVLGAPLESNTAKDANNTIRCKIDLA